MSTNHISTESVERVRSVRVYQAPKVERLGTLAELTRGGTGPITDGVGGTGDSL
ncbi:lasso RiPP family leader peptide-containing protein [Micromonospora sp. NPDC049282]|uniref:lasso RiPP family leader peptide-containing protein n=1 Tax=Micromonospora sp. NPDC049282 TaxID=3364269 RepID=UPI0037202D07